MEVPYVYAWPKKQDHRAWEPCGRARGVYHMCAGINHILGRRRKEEEEATPSVRTVRTISNIIHLFAGLAERDQQDYRIWEQNK